MNQTDNKIKFFISTSILTFIGLLNLLMVLFLQFDRYVSIEMASGVIFAVVISLVMSALFVFIKRQWNNRRRRHCILDSQGSCYGRNGRVYKCCYK